MKKNSVIFLLMILLCAGFSRVNAQKVNIDYKEYDLPNGLHVILHQDNSTPIVAVTVLYHVGAKNERPDRTGFAHFFEHLMFEGTANIGRGEYSKIVEKAGGTLNANTTTDRTYYFELLPSNQLELGLYLESERMLHARVDAIGIKTQKGVVTEEKKQNYDNRPYGSVLPEIMKRAFSKHPYRWTTIGDAAHIQAAEDKEFVEFYETYYVPNNAVLCIAGDIQIDKIKPLIEKYYGEIKKGTKEMYRPEVNMEPKLAGEVRDTVFDNIQLPAVVQAYRIPAMGTTDYYAVDLLAKVLSQGESSRMYKSLVDEQQKAMTIFAFPMQMEHPGVTLIYGIPNVGITPDALENAMNAEIEKIQKESITDKELEKLKNQIEAEFVNQNANISSRAYNLAEYYTYYRNTGLINTEIDNYLKITKDDIKRVANQYFVKDNRVVLYYLPKSGKSK